jgi:hypothetical protein
MRASDRAVAIDAGAVAGVSLAICVAARRLELMSAFVPAILVARTILWRRLPPPARRHGLPAEIAYLFACAAIGGLNDWNTVVRHRVYDYTVPVDLPALSSIPTWMFLYWGLILRALATVARWDRLGPEAPPRGRPLVRLAILAVLVTITRHTIYRAYLDPIWSWLPFAVALAAHALVLRPARRERTLALALLVAGPIVEALYIQAGGLHRYRLGWLLGVPLWIPLWWALGALVWAEVSGHVERLLARPRV